ncbi:hypothetical protein MJH12_17980, partial [bacterium]|nr:hypothetical protein [bacterium]
MGVLFYNLWKLYASKVLISLCLFNFLVLSIYAYAPGWSMIPGQNLSLTQFTSEHPEVDRVFEFTQDSWIVWSDLSHPQLQSLDSLTNMTAQKAYWIHSSIFSQSSITSQLNGKQYSGDIQIQFTLNHFQGMSVELILEYSLNNGLSFQRSTFISGNFSNLNELTQGTLTWHS